MSGPALSYGRALVAGIDASSGCANRTRESSSTRISSRPATEIASCTNVRDPARHPSATGSSYRSPPRPTEPTPSVHLVEKCLNEVKLGVAPDTAPVITLQFSRAAHRVTSAQRPDRCDTFVQPAPDPLEGADPPARPGRSRSATRSGGLRRRTRTDGGRPLPVRADTRGRLGHDVEVASGLRDPWPSSTPSAGKPSGTETACRRWECCSARGRGGRTRPRHRGPVARACLL